MAAFEGIMSEQSGVLKEAIKMRELPPGKYIMTDYEFKTNNIGSSYIINCTDENNNSFRCWSNSYMYKYLLERKPKRKFFFTIKDERINIPGYASKVVLA